MRVIHLFTALPGIFKRTTPNKNGNDEHILPITEPVRSVGNPVTWHIIRAIYRPGSLARSFARGEVDLRDGKLVDSTVEDTHTRRVQHCRRPLPQPPIKP